MLGTSLKWSKGETTLFMIRDISQGTNSFYYMHHHKFLFLLLTQNYNYHPSSNSKNNPHIPHTIK